MEQEKNMEQPAIPEINFDEFEPASYETWKEEAMTMTEDFLLRVLTKQLVMLIINTTNQYFIWVFCELKCRSV